MKGDKGLSEGSLFPTLALVSPILVLSKPYNQRANSLLSCSLSVTIPYQGNIVSIWFPYLPCLSYLGKLW